MTFILTTMMRMWVNRFSESVFDFKWVLKATLVGISVGAWFGMAGVSHFRNEKATFTTARHWNFKSPYQYNESFDLDLKQVNTSCPRFVYFNMGHAGLGDRFICLMIPLIFAIDTLSVPVADLNLAFDQDSGRGNYSWAKELFNLQALFAAKSDITEDIANKKLSHVKIPNDHTSYKTEVERAKEQCDVVIEIHDHICDGLCFQLSKPRLQRLHKMLSYALLHTDARLPALVYSREWYNVMIHVRVGDITLHHEPYYFKNIKCQLDVLLKHFNVHYYFVGEAPDKTDNTPIFDFLPDIFKDDAKTRISHINSMDVRTTLLHMMNADMLVTTGSSFPYIAVSTSPKAVILFGQPKEGYHEGYVRDDFILLDSRGMIAGPSLSEAEANILVQFAEFHDRNFPYDYTHW